MLNKTGMLAALAASGALLALPAVGLAGHGHGHGNSNSHGQGSAHSCKALNVGYTVRGTLISYTADDPATTDTNEAVVVLKVTNGNRHARRSGELADQDPDTDGTQVKGGTYTATAADDAFTVKLTAYTGADTPSLGDKVKVTGKIKLTKKRCAEDGTSVADRYAEPNIKKIKIHDGDPDTP